MLRSVVLTLVPIALGIIVCVLFDHLERRKIAIRGVVGPYFASIALIFGLFASLMASEIWQKSSRINTALTSEMSSLRGLLRISEVIPDPSGYVKGAVASYVSIIGQSELAAREPGPDQEMDRSLDVIRGLFEFAAQPSNFHDNAVLNKTFIDELNKVRSARFERMQVEESQASNLKIKFLLFFGFLTQVAIALCHTGQRRASWATVMLFSFTFAATMTLITIIDNPLSARIVSLKPLGEVH